MFFFHSKFKEKLTETLKAVIPILAIVLLLCFTIAPIPPSILMTFLIGAILLIIGMLFFNVGVEVSMTPIGAVLALGMIYNPESAEQVSESIPIINLRECPGVLICSI